MTEEIAVVPAVPAVTEKPNWVGKMCPILSAQSLSPAPQPQAIVIGGTMERRGPVEAHATGCQGPQCMAYLPIQETDAAGVTVMTNNGMCGAFTAPVAVNQLGAQLAATMVDIFNRLTAPKSVALPPKQMPYRKG